MCQESFKIRAHLVLSLAHSVAQFSSVNLALVIISRIMPVFSNDGAFYLGQVKKVDDDTVVEVQIRVVDEATNSVRNPVRR